MATIKDVAKMAGDPRVSALDRGPDRYGAVAAQMLLERLDAGRDAAVPIEPRVLAPSPLIARDSS